MLEKAKSLDEVIRLTYGLLLAQYEMVLKVVKKRSPVYEKTLKSLTTAKESKARYLAAYNRLDNACPNLKLRVKKKRGGNYKVYFSPDGLHYTRYVLERTGLAQAQIELVERLAEEQEQKNETI